MEIERKLEKKTAETPAEAYLLSLLADIENFLNNLGGYIAFVKELSIKNPKELTKEEYTNLRGWAYNLLSLSIKIYTKTKALINTITELKRFEKELDESFNNLKENFLPDEDKALNFAITINKIVSNSILQKITQEVRKLGWAKEL